ncbi:YhgE/Pip domain-containing protein [Clostridium sp.]|uniref:YhgE/Pip domain-containing protein n=1 Tax=Clostridium sp. TaxID=1506 RepID=UPI0028432509|nr:YhgE/Pip domain-containing protein [Clostridium sp.]MDR3596152.1 YhgE/Pip domain-containing protein [Clostridium sp.]
MSTILKIYKRDIKKIVTNTPLMLIIVGLLFVPALYAWINIIASWDPYGNTKGLLVAVVNNDKGAKFQSIEINVGNEVVDKLRNNESIGWTFVNQSETESGVKYGKYYASITIPEDFSSNLISIAANGAPKKADLIYSVNEKMNAIAPKITKSGLTSLQSEITSSVTEEVSNTVLNYLDAYGIAVEKMEPALKDFMNIITDIDNNLPQIGESIDNAYNGVVDLNKFIENIQDNMPNITHSLDNAQNAMKSSNDFFSEVNSTIKNISPYIKTDLAGAKANASTAKNNLNNLKNSIDKDVKGQQELLKSAATNMSSAISAINNDINILQSVNNILHSDLLSNFISKMQNVRDALVQNKLNLDNLITTLSNGNKLSSDAIDSVIQNIDKTSQLMDDSISNFDNTISPQIDSLVNNTTDMTNNSLRLLESAKNNIPIINSLLKDANAGTDLGAAQVKNIKDKFPQIEQTIHSNVESFKNLDNDEKLNELSNLLQKDPKNVSDFLANPINLVQNRIFPIPNYGSAMAPFYSTLAIWVGGFTLLSILSIHVEPLEEVKNLGTTKKFFGRFLTLATLSLLQTFIIVLGNFFFIKTYAVSPVIFLIFSLYVGLVFIMIIYTLVSVFGNVGKALALIIMVLQVSASGGTFPIQLTPKFFQNISPMLPFTYAIGGMREAEGGIIWSSLYYNAGILSIYFFISIIVAIFLKEKVNKKSEKFINKMKESGLVGE